MSPCRAQWRPSDLETTGAVFQPWSYDEAMPATGSLSPGRKRCGRPGSADKIQPASLPFRHLAEGRGKPYARLCRRAAPAGWSSMRLRFNAEGLSGRNTGRLCASAKEGDDRGLDAVPALTIRRRLSSVHPTRCDRGQATKGVPSTEPGTALCSAPAAHGPTHLDPA